MRRVLRSKPHADNVHKRSMQNLRPEHGSVEAARKRVVVLRDVRHTRSKRIDLLVCNIRDDQIPAVVAEVAEGGWVGGHDIVAY